MFSKGIKSMAHIKSTHRERKVRVSKGMQTNFCVGVAV